MKSLKKFNAWTNKNDYVVKGKAQNYLVKPESKTTEKVKVETGGSCACSAD